MGCWAAARQQRSTAQLPMADLKKRNSKVNAADERSPKVATIEEWSKKAPEKMRPYILKAAPYLVMAQELFIATLPFLIQAYNFVLWAWEQLQPYHPQELLPVVVGITMAFLGGEFPVLMAAVEAYRQIGWEDTWKAVQHLYANARVVLQEHQKDDQRDDDGDGIPDTQQITQAEYVQRKTMLVLRTVNPEESTKALEAVAQGAAAVIAVLKVKFAKIIALGASIGDCLRAPVMTYCLPRLKPLLPDDLQKWAAPFLSYIYKVVAITLTWWIQRFISAAHSAVRGGHMAGQGVVNYLHKFGYIKTHADDTYADEIAGGIIAFAGFFWQVSIGFRLFFPLNLLLLPVSIAEYIMVWIIGQ